MQHNKALFTRKKKSSVHIKQKNDYHTKSFYVTCKQDLTLITTTKHSMTLTKDQETKA